MVIDSYLPGIDITCQLTYKRRTVHLKSSTCIILIYTTSISFSFRECCEKAFMILRKQGNLLITLFAMMLSSGIPELSDDTIHYLRETLVLDKGDDEALRHFQSKFNEALKNSWKTSVNWMMHHLANPD